MSINLPIVALSIVGVLLAAYGIFVEQSISIIAAGIATILFGWVLQEMSKRRT